MKQMSTGILAALMAAALGTSVLAPVVAQGQGKISNLTIAQAPNAPPADFGSPPSGSIPILFNDHHVYTKPDVLKQGRVLAALAQGGTILIPLRSMFEQMGATVSYDPGSRTATVSKAGSEVKVTVGRPEVVINGETRPLDVPPEIYQGSVLVPVRVISEGMGAYVEWEPDKRLVVVRYMPATPPPPPATPAPTEAPTMAPTPVQTATPYNDAFIVGDYLFSPKIYNEFSPGNTGKSSYSGRAALEFSAFNIPWMIEGDFRQFQYPHGQGVATPALRAPCAPAGDQACVTVIGGNGSTFVPAFTARDQDFEGRLGVRVINPRVYVGVGYMWRDTNYGYPQLKAWGFGLEKLPDLEQNFTFYASGWYYPNLKGTYQPTGQVLAYNVTKWEGGVIWRPSGSPVFLDLGWLGTSMTNKTNAPIGVNQNGPYAGIGIRF